MPVPLSLLEKISKYEQEGYSPEEIVGGLVESQAYPDVAKKTQEYLKGGYPALEILDGVKSSSVSTEEQKFFRGFRRGMPVIESQAEMKARTSGKGEVSPERQAEALEALKFPEEIMSEELERGERAKREPGIYAERRVPADIAERFLPLSDVLWGEQKLRSTETAMEAIPWIAGSATFRNIMRGLAGIKQSGITTKLISELMKRPYAEQAILLGKEEAPKGKIVEEFLRQRADAALKTPPFLRTAEDLLVLKEVTKQGPALPSVKLTPKVEVPVTIGGTKPPKIPIEEPGKVGGEAEVLHGKLKTEGGFSFRPDTPEPPPGGYMVGVPGHGREIPGVADPGAIAKWQSSVADAVTSNKRYFYGGELTEGKTILDVSEWIPTEGEAVKATLKRGEKRYYDIDAGISKTPTKVMGETGQVEVGYHYSKEPRTELRGAATPEETQRYSGGIRSSMEAAIDHPEWPYVPEVNVYGPGAKPEVIVKSGKVRHKVEYELNDLYDLNKDPLKIGLRAEEIVWNSPDWGWKRNVVSNLIKRERYKGFISGENRYLFGEVKAQVGAGGLGLLPHMAGTAVGAVTGGVVDEDNPIRGAVLGGAAGFGMTRGLAAIISKMGTKIPAEIKKVPGGLEIPPLKKGAIDWDLRELNLRFHPEKEVATRATIDMILEGTERDPNKLFTQQIIDAIHTNPEHFVEITKAYGVTPEQFIQTFKESSRQWGTKLGLLGNLSKKLQGIKDPATQKMIKELLDVAGEPNVWDHAQYWWRRVDNVRRALLVTQLSTAMRNAETQAGRVGLDVFEQALSSGLQQVWKGVGGKVARPVDPLDGVEQFFGLFQRHKADVDRVLKAFPQQYDRLLGTYSSDITSATGKTIDSAVQLINTPNRFQEFLLRRNVFMSELGRRVEARGLDLKSIIQNNKVGNIDIEDIRKAVNKALEFTFAENPKWGSVGQKFISFVNSLPTASWVLPFPRFMVNSLKFNYQYSPLGMLNLLSKAEWQAFKAGNMQVVSRATLGSAMLGAAWQFRNSEYAGEKWYELQLPDGKTIDMRPYNPFGAYLFVADLAKKIKDDEFYKMTWQDIVQGIAGTNLRAGAGLWTVDKIISAFTEFSSEADWERAKRDLKTLTGEVVGGFATPLNMVKEFLAGFDDFVIKERKEEPFLGPIKTKIPYVEAGLPAAQRPTREAPITTKAPAFRQMTGLAISPSKNYFEKELDRLGFDRREILPSTGDPEADRYVAQKMGYIAENFFLPFMETEDYKTLKDHERGLFLKEVIEDMRKDAREWAASEHPELFERLEKERLPKREKLYLRKEGILQ